MRGFVCGEDGRASVKSRSAVTDNSRKTLELYLSRDFPSRLHRVCLVPNRPRILCESVANRWKIGQENSLGQTSVRLPGRYRAWLLGQRGAIAALIICELPGNYARIYFLAVGSSGGLAFAIYLQFLTEATAGEWGAFRY